MIDYNGIGTVVSKYVVVVLVRCIAAKRHCMLCTTLRFSPKSIRFLKEHSFSTTEEASTDLIELLCFVLLCKQIAAIMHQHRKYTKKSGPMAL